MTSYDFAHTFDCYRDLAEAIILQSFEDFKNDCDLIVKLKHMRDLCDKAIIKVKKDKQECFDFFKSEWYDELSQSRFKDKDIIGELKKYEGQVLGSQE